ncbi:hypothetical protein GXP70_06905 [Paenibacillus lycopersici]|uniref:Uncharacterized protein n=1 Tax=Paenibacillus lycopersici TaxID=2704462 RepID=A0A6C0FRD9_9BACL|nr:hypothetical protein [Paenibacillus lycopersici]QHT59706.1 hypothetical protein GXP70_06905 [Paenibacillus lycopersici]
MLHPSIKSRAIIVLASGLLFLAVSLSTAYVLETNKNSQHLNWMMSVDIALFVMTILNAATLLAKLKRR